MQQFQVTTDLLNSENLKVAIAQLCNDLQACNVTMVVKDTLNAIVFTLQLIYSTVITSK